MLGLYTIFLRNTKRITDACKNGREALAMMAQDHVSHPHKVDTFRFLENTLHGYITTLVRAQPDNSLVRALERMILRTLRNERTTPAMYVEGFDETICTALYSFAEILGSSGRRSAACDALAHVVEITQSRLKAYSHAGGSLEVHEVDGKIHAVIEHDAVPSSTKLSPRAQQLIQALKTYAETLEAAGRVDEAVACFEQALDIAQGRTSRPEQRQTPKCDSQQLHVAINAYANALEEVAQFKNVIIVDQSNIQPQSHIDETFRELLTLFVRLARLQSTWTAAWDIVPVRRRLTEPAGDPTLDPRLTKAVAFDPAGWTKILRTSRSEAQKWLDSEEKKRKHVNFGVRGPARRKQKTGSLAATSPPKRRRRGEEKGMS